MDDPAPAVCRPTYWNWNSPASNWQSVTVMDAATVLAVLALAAVNVDADVTAVVVLVAPPVVAVVTAYYCRHR